MKWRDLTEEQREERRAEQRAAEAARREFTDQKLSESAAASFLGVTGPAMARLLAEGRTTLWAEDLARYRARRDSVPQPGKPYPPITNRARKAAADAAELGELISDGDQDDDRDDDEQPEEGRVAA